ncbi:fibroblast growth factor 19 [Bufo bufo]|uniref:fibroblast growth factor 19 n=1 Tax=Bufo bufo TaxID=8384 RepID=UPI001ABEB83C|nr:fibroblast growth factor 19 [Bufo bufo]
MWKRLLQLLGCVVLVELWLVRPVCALPLPDAGPHVHTGWGETIRIRRLQTVRRHGQESYYLRIHNDGRVDAERHTSPQSLLEIRAVDIGLVVFKGYHSSLYLCMATDGTLYGMNAYSPEDCSFIEIIAGRFNVYKSPKYGMAISINKDKSRQQSKGKGSLSHFLPVTQWDPLDLYQDDGEDDEYPYDNGHKNSHNVESMDPLRLVDHRTFHKN